ncbi:MAG: AAA family ATPase [Anaerolineae bacterium]|nr:AAA family ATPase [Anaerolineae bacterium]
MRCPTCGAENRDDARFCIHCGARLSLICPACGRQLPPEAIFCDACGARVVAVPDQSKEEAAAPDAATDRLRRLLPQAFAERLRASGGQMAGERRVVTILFCDVTGSTAMAEALDPEDVMEIMDGAFDVMIEPIVRYEGTVARLMGDAVLAFFGAPIAHEDDPERACRAALEITAEAQRYAGELDRERGVSSFDVQVGINTGLVVVGEVGSDLRVEYTAMGDAINVAAHMEDLAEPGTILITEDTQELIASIFQTDALGPVKVKGKAEPVSTYRVLSAKPAPGKMRGIAGLESPLVGREAEFRALQAAVDRLEAGVGGIVTLVGEAGIGKSRLVAEVRKRVMRQGRPGSGPQDRGATHGRADSTRRLGRSSHLTWVEGRCLSYGTSISYLLWLDILRDLVGVTLEETPEAVADALRQRARDLCPEEVADVYVYLARMLSVPLRGDEVRRLDGMAGRDLKARTFEAIETLIARAAGERPLVVVGEDLQWSDPTSLSLLEQIFPLVDGAPLLLIAVLRPRRDHGSWDLRETAAREWAHRHTDLRLEPLSIAHSETLVGHLLHVESLPPTLRDRILAQAEGNPFYAEEIIRSFIDQGALVQDEVTGRWEATRDVVEIPIPDTLHGVLTARIDRLQQGTKRVLQMASVIGRVFLFRVLAEIAADQRRLDDRLLTLQREEMIRERARLPELEYIFKHELTREAAYNGLLKKERRVYHRDVAEALERLFPNRVEAQAGLLAHHWERAGDAEKAIHYLLQAGDAARDLYAHDEAIDYYRRALVFLRRGEEHQRAARVLMKLGQTYHAAFDFQRSRDAYEEGFALRQKTARGPESAVLARAPHPLRLVLSGSEPDTLDPAMSTDVTSSEVIGQLFDGLVGLSPDMDVVPNVAHSWEVQADGQRYVFHLRDDVRWSDGSPLTAHDFAYAWRRVLSPATSSPVANLLYSLRGARAYHRGEVTIDESVGVRAADERTLVVELERPTGHFLRMLDEPTWYAVPAHVVDANGSTWTEPGTIVSSGPCTLAVWEPGERLILLRNPFHRGRHLGNVERVEILLYTSHGWREAVALYEEDQLDVFHLQIVPGAELDSILQRHAGEHIPLPELVTWSLVLNTERPPLDDTRVRQALALCTDRRRIAAAIGHGVIPASGGFVPPGMPGHSPGIALPYDPERARQLLVEAGYPDGRRLPTLDVLLLSASHAKPFAAILEADWRDELGVEATWAFAGWDVYWERVSREQPHISFLGWFVDYVDPDSFLRLGLKRAQPHTHWKNDSYQHLVEEARRSIDQERRLALYRRADRILMEDAPIVPLSYGRMHWLAKPWVTRYPLSPVRRLFAEDVIIESH